MALIEIDGLPSYKKWVDLFHGKLAMSQPEGVPNPIHNPLKIPINPIKSH